jgi:hypothetical protein
MVWYADKELVLLAQSSVAVGEYSLINEKALHFCEASTYPERTKIATG